MQTPSTTSPQLAVPWSLASAVLWLLFVGCDSSGGAAEPSDASAWDAAPAVDAPARACAPGVPCPPDQVCVDGYCRFTEVPAGDRGGPCYGNGTCNGDLACVDGRCGDDRPGGAIGAPCDEQAPCAPDLRCVDARCVDAPDDRPHHLDPACGAVITPLRVLSRHAGLAANEATASAVVALLSITDCEGVPIEGLSAADLTAFEDGAPLSVEAGRLVTRPADATTRLSVVLALDLSSSIEGSLADVLGAARGFVDALESAGAEVDIGVLPFAGDALYVDPGARFTTHRIDGQRHDVLMPTRDLDAVRAYLAALEDFAPGDPRSTNLRQAIAAASDLAGRHGFDVEERSEWGLLTVAVAVVFTDGQDTAGFEARRPDTTVLAVALETPDLDVDELGRLISVDGTPLPNNVVRAESNLALYAAFARVAENLVDRTRTAAHLIAYCSPSRAGDHTLSLAVSGAGSNRGSAIPFSATPAGARCDARVLEAACEDDACGGLLCGGCDDAEAVCSNGRCESWCAVAGLCDAASTLPPPLGGETLTCGPAACPRGSIAPPQFALADPPGAMVAPVGLDPTIDFADVYSDGRGRLLVPRFAASAACPPGSVELTLTPWVPTRRALGEAGAAEPTLTTCVAYDGDAGTHPTSDAPQATTFSADGARGILAGRYAAEGVAAHYALRVDLIEGVVEQTDMGDTPAPTAMLPDGRWITWTPRDLDGVVQIHDATGVVEALPIRDILPDWERFETGEDGFNISVCPTHEGRLLVIADEGGPDGPPNVAARRLALVELRDGAAELLEESELRTLARMHCFHGVLRGSRFEGREFVSYATFDDGGRLRSTSYPDQWFLPNDALVEAAGPDGRTRLHHLSRRAEASVVSVFATTTICSDHGCSGATQFMHADRDPLDFLLLGPTLYLARDRRMGRTFRTSTGASLQLRGGLVGVLPRSDDLLEFDGRPGKD